MHWTNARWKHLASTAFKWRLDKLMHTRMDVLLFNPYKLLATQNDKLSCEATQDRIILCSPYEHTYNDDDDDPDDDDASDDSDCYHDCFCTSV